jgi:hypothetical protein
MRWDEPNAFCLTTPPPFLRLWGEMRWTGLLQGFARLISEVVSLSQVRQGRWMVTWELERNCILHVNSFRLGISDDWTMTLRFASRFQILHILQLYLRKKDSLPRRWRLVNSDVAGDVTFIGSHRSVNWFRVDIGLHVTDAPSVRRNLHKH